MCCLRKGGNKGAMRMRCGIQVLSVADPGCLSRIQMFSIPDPNLFHPGSRIRIKKFNYLTQKSVSKLSEIWSGLFILDPDPVFYYQSRIPDPGVQKAPEPGSATLQVLLYFWQFSNRIRYRYDTLRITNLKIEYGPELSMWKDEKITHTFGSGIIDSGSGILGWNQSGSWVLMTENYSRLPVPHLCLA
jgi:hypothetical protein